MQLPAISSLVSLLSSSLNGLKDLGKGTALVAATYFALLHFVLIFPPLRDSGFLPIVAFERLPTVWQVVLGTFILFALAFILNVMGESFLNLVNGRALQDGIPQLASLFRGLQIESFRRLLKTIQDGESNRDWSAEDAADKLAYEFPDEERDLAATRLGNILLSPASYTYRQYGARLDTIWPILFRKLTDEKLSTKITSEMEAIIFLATMSTLSALVALEIPLVVVWFGNSLQSLLWCPVLLVVALVFYYATFPKARGWGLGIRSAFDQHLDLAADGLGLEKLTDIEKKQERWREVSAWLSIGPLRKGLINARFTTIRRGEPLLGQKQNWYQAAEPLTVKHPPDVTVSDQSGVIAEWPNNTSDDRRSWRLAGQEIAYIIAVTNQGNNPVIGTRLDIVDTRLPALPVKVFGTPGSTGGSRLEAFRVLATSESPQSLRWVLPSIPGSGKEVLRYQIRFDCSIRITEGGATITENQPNRITLKPTGTETVTFEIDVMNQSQLTPLYDVSGNPLSPSSPAAAENETERQVTQRATFQTGGEVQIHWNGRQFVPLIGF